MLSGSSGRVETERCRVLAEAGALALSVRWFGDEGQPPGICELPLESFEAPLSMLRAECDRVALLGTSKGAEAALLLAAAHRDVAAVIAVAPTPWVWANVGPGHDGRDRPQRSSWTRERLPLPFLPYVEGWEWAGPGLVQLRGLYDESIRSAAAARSAAAIPVEAIGGAVVLAAGGDDRMWDSVRHAEVIRRERVAHGLPTTLVTHPRAGHRLVLPGEAPAPPSTTWDHGGTPEADAELGARLWPELVRVLGLQ